ncbi:flippase [Candidatus Uhrbacteria bacterium]|nr:flippase [Candidatus Uhrbacteria bacterium]
MSLTRKIARNTLSQVIGKIVGTVLGLLCIGLMTRYLGQVGFGQYTTVMTFLQFFGILVDFGLTMITAQMIAPLDGAEEEKVLANLFTLRLVSAVIFLGLAPVIVLLMPYESAIKTGVAVAAASYLFIALNQVLMGLFQKKLDMNRTAAAEIFNRVLLLGLTWLVVAENWGLNGILGAVVISNAVQFGLLYVFSVKHTRLHFRYDPKIWQEIFHLSWPIAVSIGLNLIYLKSDTLILSLIKSQAEVGIYGATYKVIDVLVSMPILFAGLVLPVLSRHWARGDREHYTRVFQKSFDALVLVALPLVVGTWFVSREVMVLIAGQDFAASGPVLNILIIAAGIIFIGAMFGHAIVSLNKQKQTIWAYGASAVLSLAGYLIFIPIYSYFGAAWMTVFSESFVTLSLIYVFYKTTKFFPATKTALRGAGATLIMAGGLWWLTRELNTSHLLINVLTHVLGAIIIYAGALLVTGTVTPKLVKEIIRPD